MFYIVDLDNEMSVLVVVVWRMTYEQPAIHQRHANSLFEDERDAPGLCHEHLSFPDLLPATPEPLVVVDVLSGAPGCGKSEKMLVEAANTPGHYLFAFLTTELADEQAQRFAILAPKATLSVIHSKRGRGAVGSRLTQARTGSENQNHSVVFVTHEALVTNDLGQFQGWHLRIDECPNVTGSGHLKLAHSVAHYKSAFNLEPVEAGWSLVRTAGPGASWKEIANDTMGVTIRDFHAWADRPADLLLNLDSFTGPEIRKRVPWVAIWQLGQVAVFSSVTIAASNFIGSITHRVWASLYGARVEFRENRLGLAQTAQPKISIGYFTAAHEGTTVFWKGEGHACIVKVEEWLKHNRPDLGYWSSNDAIEHDFLDRIKGKAEKPKLAGLNRLRDETSCAMIYSSKAVQGDEPIIAMFDIGKKEVQASREDEDIFQFVCRGAIRDPNYGGQYDAYVYSRSQAERLATKLTDAGYYDVTCTGIASAGIMSVQRLPPGGRAPGDDPATKAALAKQQSARRSKLYRLRKKAQRTGASSAGEIISTGPFSSSPVT